MKELRTLGDEAARILQACAQEGLAPPVDQRQDFETLMRLVSARNLPPSRSKSVLTVDCVYQNYHVHCIRHSFGLWAHDVFLKNYFAHKCIKRQLFVLANSLHAATHRYTL